MHWLRNLTTREKGDIAVKKWSFFIIFVLLIRSVTGSLAQEDQASPLLTLFSYVPVRPEILASEIIYYNLPAFLPPYAALTGQALDAIAEDDLKSFHQFAIVNRNYFASNVLRMALPFPDEVEKYSGIRPEQIQTMLEYGISPLRGIVMQGEFNLETIATAHTARGYNQRPLEDFTLWCGDPTCDGTLIVEGEDDWRNLFDVPPLGRKPAVAVSDAFILASANRGVVIGGVQQHTKGEQTLAQLPEMLAINNLLTQDAPGELLQAFIMPAGLVATTFPMIEPTMSPTDIAITAFGLVNTDALNRLVAEVKEYGPLPPFRGLIFADYFDGTQDIMVMALMYPDAASAQTAVDELVRRILTYRDVIFNPGESQTFLEMAGVTAPQTSVYLDDDTDIAFARLTMSYPLPSYEPGSMAVPQTGRLFRLFMDAFYNRTLFALWQIDLPADLKKVR